MSSHPIHTQPLYALIKGLIRGDEGFDDRLRDNRETLRRIQDEACESPKAWPLIEFICINLAPVSQLPASETKKLGKRLKQVLHQAEQILAGELDGYTQDLAEAVYGAFWPEPARFEISIEESQRRKGKKKKGANKHRPKKDAPNITAQPPTDAAPAAAFVQEDAPAPDVTMPEPEEDVAPAPEFVQEDAPDPDVATPEPEDAAPAPEFVQEDAPDPDVTMPEPEEDAAPAPEFVQEDAPTPDVTTPEPEEDVAPATEPQAPPPSLSAADADDANDANSADSPEPAAPSSASLSQVYARLAALSERLEPFLMESLLGLLEAEDETTWQHSLEQSAALMEPLSIASEMAGLTPLDQLFRALDDTLRSLPMPEDEEARSELVLGLADLPVLLASLFSSDPQESGVLAEELLNAAGYGLDYEPLTEGMGEMLAEMAGLAEDALLILDAAGIEAMAADAIAAVQPPSGTQAPVSSDEPQATNDDLQATSYTPEEAAEPPGPGFSPETMDLLALLAAGISECRIKMEQLGHALMESDDARWHRGTAHYAELLQRLQMAAETIEFDALHQGASLLAQRLAEAPFPSDRDVQARFCTNLIELPQRLLDFLAAPHQDDTLLALYAVFEESGALEGMEETERMGFLEGLSRGPADEETPLETPTVRAQDLSLTPDSDADRSVLDSVASEGPRLAGDFARILQQIIAGEELPENLRRAQRSVHTLKGSANICGIRGIANLSHHLEDLLEHLGQKGEAPNPTLAAVLVDAADALESALEVVFSGEEQDPQVFASIVAKVVGWSSAIRRGLDQPLEVVVEGLAEAAPADKETADDTATTAKGGPSPLAPSISLVDGLQKQMGELSISMTQAESRIAKAREALDQMAKQHQRNLRNVEKLEELADIRGLGTRFGNLVAKGSQARAEQYDPLELEEYNELYITTRRLQEGEADALALAEGLNDTIKMLEELSQNQLRLNHEMQDLIAAARRVPVSQYIPRLQRVVRQTCRSTAKSADMRVEGGELEVDNEVMEKLLPALLHILRNAIDHGIESSDQRRAIGKPEAGQLSLTFQRVGNAIEVIFSDDGAGLDYHKLRQRALATGLLAADADPEPRELALLTLKPGFSTREQVSEISGRGVGMNVVDAAIRELKGALSIDSETGQGYTLTMRLPTSTISMYTLLVTVGDEVFAVPGSEVKYAVAFADGELEEEGEARFFCYGDERFPLEELAELAGIRRSSRVADRPIVLIAYSDVDERAVLADSLDDSRMVIAKKLGSLVPPIPGVSSATILGDGSIVPILELRRLLRRDGFDATLNAYDTSDQERIKAPGVLVVDDSLSMRKSLSQLVADGGWRALTAVDGLDALRVMEEEMPDVLLVDMEMPRMNGLELTSHLRNNPATRHLPIAMITSRATASHRNKAMEAGVDHYFVKPYREDEVLEFIEQRLHARDSGEQQHE